MPKVRAKFRVASIAGETLKSITLYPVVGGSPENDEFFNATPGGSINLGVLNAPAAAQFEVGQEFYVDFIPVKGVADVA